MISKMHSICKKTEDVPNETEIRKRKPYTQDAGNSAPLMWLYYDSNCILTHYVVSLREKLDDPAFSSLFVFYKFGLNGAINRKHFK